MGAADPFSALQITLDGKINFTAQTDANGDWLFKLPVALTLGVHTFTVQATDPAGNISDKTALSVTKIVTIPEVAPVAIVRPATAPTPAQPAPIALVRAVENAVTLPGLATPKIVSAQVPVTAAADIMSFSGTAQPNQDVVIYIHSDQAVIYNTKADSKGVWTINHSQNTVELTPGLHTIYAIGLDQAAKVKSLPSTISQFTVTKNFWVVIYSYLNLYTTVVTIAVILLAMFWLYRIKKKQK